MTALLSSEWLKLRTVRSTAVLLAVLALALLGGAAIAYLMTADWDQAAPEVRLRFEAADPALPVVPIGQFCLGVLGALAITAEHGGGMIRPALVAVPRRGAFLAAKTLVVAATATALALLLSLAATGLGEWITGDRPVPIAAFPELSDAWPTVLANALVMAVSALVGLGLGFAVRSSAGALTTLSVLQFVIPTASLLLPRPWNEYVYGTSLAALAPQLAGAQPDPLLSPWGAGLAVALHAVLALGAGAVVLLRRDA
ncbi:ABC transporter permease [Actinosynnema pretiosum subsp. pretiosum]|uniref:ABC transporter permease n=1 Tax=Actinosynnema pretiosum subsp. pretiosum TaxID=103721 RepID=A0AA45LA76_9PSEU|nr:putative integral membrane protein [Actinosynnema pretiosum subsp. pretiosum]QUF06141.1 ABC transporter permease [Actinosynnema pretiosum subsp. pretiosum]